MMKIFLDQWLCQQKVVLKLDYGFPNSNIATVKDVIAEWFLRIFLMASSICMLTEKLSRVYYILAWIFWASQKCYCIHVHFGSASDFPPELNCVCDYR